MAEPVAVVAATAEPPSTTAAQAEGKSKEEAPRKLGNYIMLQTLGEGGFSKVKLGLVEGTNEKVALKILKKDKLNLSSSTRRQVEREIAAMTKIQHPNVIRLKEVDWDAVYVKKNGKKSDVILVVLELATGGELFEFLSFTGCFEEAIARTYFHQLIAGVGYCHSKGVVHRDLKPENLLLDSSFVLKLADFGFSNIFTSGDKTMYTECGTPGYMAPEMVKNTSGYEPTGADIWACGVILFIMLAGFPPFQKPSLTDWWFQKLATGKHHLFWQAHSRNAYFSDNTKDFINKILCPDPSKRITIADIKKHPWFNGPVISNSALITELTRRKNEVDEAKLREKMEKKKAREPATEATGGKLDAVVVRGEGGEDSDMPLAPPSMSSRFGFGGDDAVDAEGGAGASAAGAAGEVAFDGESLGGFSSVGGGAGEAAGELSLDGDISSLSLSDAGKTEKKMPAPVKYDASFGTACYTRFESERSAPQILARLARAFQSMGQFAMEEDKYKIKAKLLTSAGNVTIAAQVFADPATAASSAPTCIVEFRRRQGDSMQFRNLYHDITAQVADIIKKKPASSAAAAAASSSATEFKEAAKSS